MNRTYLAALVTLFGMMACATTGFVDTVYVYDSDNGMLQAHLPKDDRKITDCDVQTLPSGEKQYPCVVHFDADYQRVLDEITSLQKQLSACQQGVSTEAK